MNLLKKIFLKPGKEIEQDKLADLMSLEAAKELNQAILMGEVIRTRKQVENEIKTFYRRVK